LLSFSCLNLLSKLFLLRVRYAFFFCLDMQNFWHSCVSHFNIKNLLQTWRSDLDWSLLHRRKLSQINRNSTVEITENSVYGILNLWGNTKGFIEELVFPATENTEFGVEHLAGSVASTAKVYVYSIFVIPSSDLIERRHLFWFNFIGFLLLFSCLANYRSTSFC